MKFSSRVVSLILIFFALFTLTASIALASGATWTQQTALGQQTWGGIASSADGTKLVAAANYDAHGNPGQIYISNNGGMTWATSTAPRRLGVPSSPPLTARI